MKKFIYLFATLIVLISCKGNTNNSQENDEQTTTETSVSQLKQLENQLAQATEPLEKFKLLDQIAREKAQTLSAEDFGVYFVQFKQQVNGVMAEIYAIESENQTDPETWAKERRKIYTDAGLQYAMSEGMVNKVEPKNGYYNENFGQYLPQDFKDYFKIQEAEYGENFNIVEDASLMIGVEDLADFILSIEDFIAKYPNSKLIAEVEEKYGFYQYIYLNGIDNSPVKDRNGNLLPETKAEFNRFVAAHPDSPTAQLASELLKKKEDNKFIGTWNIGDVATDDLFQLSFYDLGAEIGADYYKGGPFQEQFTCRFISDNKVELYFDDLAGSISFNELSNVEEINNDEECKVKVAECEWISASKIKVKTFNDKCGYVPGGMKLILTKQK